VTNVSIRKRNTVADIYVQLLEISRKRCDDDVFAWRCYVKEIEILQQRHWGISGLEPPPDRPVCGFFNELCSQQGMHLRVRPLPAFMSLI